MAMLKAKKLKRLFEKTQALLGRPLTLKDVRKLLSGRV